MINPRSMSQLLLRASAADADQRRQKVPFSWRANASFVALRFAEEPRRRNKDIPAGPPPPRRTLLAKDGFVRLRFTTLHPLNSRISAIIEGICFAARAWLRTISNFIAICC